MQKHHAALSSYHFQRTKTQGIIKVLNEGSYVMAEYSERTGTVKWQRVVLATQKEMIEKWLGQHYPVHPGTPPPAPAPGGDRRAETRGARRPRRPLVLGGGTPARKPRPPRPQPRHVQPPHAQPHARQPAPPVP